MKYFLPVLLIGSWCLATNAADNPEHRMDATNVVRLTSSYLTELTEQMRTNHPSLRAAAARVRAADAATNSVRSWDDPELTFGGTIADGARGPSLSEEGNLLYGVEQRLPLFGKPQAARRIAQAEAEVAGARAELQFQNLRRDLVKALFRAAYAERVLAVNHQDLTWMETLSATAEERYRAGDGSQIEVLRLQNERARRAEALRTEARRRDDLMVTINRFLNRDLGASLAKFELPEAAGEVAYTARLVELAVKHEPRLRVMRREIEIAEASVAGARKARLPEVAGFADTRQYSGDGGFREATFGVKLSLPWLNRGRYQSDVARERARLEAAMADAADQEQAVREEVHHLTVNIDAARREALLYRDQILPRSDQALTVARENWLNNRGTFSDVMEARRLLLEAQLTGSRAVAEQYQLMAELILCCGLGDFEMLQTFGITSDNPSADQPQR
jgi:cobalt-zinc-cadmium efflux system outer membrane protein